MSLDQQKHNNECSVRHQQEGLRPTGRDDAGRRGGEEEEEDGREEDPPAVHTRGRIRYLPLSIRWTQPTSVYQVNTTYLCLGEHNQPTSVCQVNTTNLPLSIRWTQPTSVCQVNTTFLWWTQPSYGEHNLLKSVRRTQPSYVRGTQPS